MPYITNVPATAITAAWGNANVRDQAVSQFATVAARDSAITSPVAGMVCYTDDFKLLWFYANAKWRFLPGQYLYAKRDTSTAFLTNVSGTNTVFTSASVTIPSGGQAYEIGFSFDVVNGGFTNGQINGELQIGYDGGAINGESQTGYSGANALSGHWSVRRTCTLKSGSTNTAVVMRLRAGVTGGNYDVTASASYPMELWMRTTGMMASEVI